MLFFIIVVAVAAFLVYMMVSGSGSHRAPVQREEEDRTNLYNTQRASTTSRPKAQRAVDNSQVLPNYTVFDFETTGLDCRKDGIVQFSAVRYRNHEEVDSLYFLSNPGMPIPEKASKIHGITDDMVRDEPSFSDRLQSVMDFIGDDVLVAHNANFDRMFLEYQMGEKLMNRLFDTLAFAKDVMAGWYAGDYKLSTLYKVLTGDKPTGAHDALADCRMAHSVLECCMERLGSQGRRPYFGWCSDPSQGWYAYDLPKREFARPAATDKGSPFFGQTFLFDGRLSGMTRRQAIMAVVGRGGDYCNQLRQKTTVVVTGKDAFRKDWAEVAAGRTPPERPLRLLSEDGFKAMLEEAGPV